MVTTFNYLIRSKLVCIMYVAFATGCYALSVQESEKSRSIKSICLSIERLAQGKKTLCCHDVWPLMERAWQRLSRCLMPEVRIQIYHLLEAVNKICCDVAWLHDSCLSKSSSCCFEQKHYSNVLPLSRYASEQFSLYRAAQNCCESSVIVSVLRGTHLSLSLGYFDNPVIERTGVNEQDVMHIERAYHFLWRRVAHEISNFVVIERDIV